MNLENLKAIEVEAVNLCEPGFMSYCSAGNKWENQKRCQFYRKASIAKRCMHYRAALGDHCDCAEAQRSVRCYRKRCI